ncbi:MAG: Hpt domain-containing protein [Desulfovibrio sp.]|nr:Hpt domain-containing protein [Desulfovibrio sp.]
MSDALSDEFFAEVGDKYYPQVLEGLEKLGAGEVGPGIEILARPLHTIKGVTGFMPGFEAASHLTHKVESFLKKLQAETLPHSADNISLAAYGVNSVFAAIEQIRDQGAPDQGEIDAVCQVLEAAAGGTQADKKGGSAVCVVKEQAPEGAVLRAVCARLHAKPQTDQIVAAILALPQTSPVILDLSAVKSCGSAVWEDLAGLAGMWTIRVRGLSGAARETFYAWDFDAVFPLEQETPISLGAPDAAETAGGAR